jgi:hypothetical protein
MTKRFTPVEIAAQRSIKRVFDPAALLNPGIMLPDVSPDGEPDLGSFEAALRTALQRHRTATATHASPAPPANATGGTQTVVNSANLSLVVGAGVTLDDRRSRCHEYPPRRRDRVRRARWRRGGCSQRQLRLPVLRAVRRHSPIDYGVDGV